MSRLAVRFGGLKEQSKKGLISYIVAGDINPNVTVPMMHELVAQGTDVIELGVPFSDPMAEGPVIQLAHERSLEYGTSLRDTLDMVSEFRKTDDKTPVVLMGYANPVEVMGYETFANVAVEAGVDGVITVDMPPEEVAGMNKELQRVGMDNIFLIAPTTSDQRIEKIVAPASGFLYYVSLKGVTGAGHLDIDAVAASCARIRARSSLPLAVGFGIKSAESAVAVAEVADAVVVGSAVVNAMLEAAEISDVTNSDSANSDDIATLCKNSAALIGEIRRALDS